MKAFARASTQRLEPISRSGVAPFTRMTRTAGGQCEIDGIARFDTQPIARRLGDDDLPLAVPLT
jgi:hypothetical protein